MNMWSSRNSSDENSMKRKGKAVEASNFAQTCNLLSQYMKEKGSLRDLNLEIGGKVESIEALVKPGSSIAASNSRYDGKSSLENPIIVGEGEGEDDASDKATTSKDGLTNRDPKTAQLTIFYSGKVLVFEDYPAYKVRDLVHVAKKGSSQMSYGITCGVVQDKPNNPPRDGLPPRPQLPKQQPVATTSEAGPSCSKPQKQLSPPPSEGNGSDLPIARRSSLHRFLEKRKDRAAVRGPYQNQEHPAPFFKGDDQLDLNNFP